MKNNNPTVDVIIPVYNGEDFILEALNSVVGQTYKPSQIIVIDDGSTDSTADIIKNFQSTDANIKYFYKKNGGLSSARNAGIKLASSDCLAFLDADDIWLPEKLEKQVVKLASDGILKGKGVVYSDFSLIDRIGNSINQHKKSSINKHLRGNIYNSLLKGNYVSGSGSAVLISKDCFEECGLFDTNLPACEDWDMWLRISEKYQFDYVDEKLVKIRQHNNSMQKNNNKMTMGYLVFFGKLFDRGQLTLLNLLILREHLRDCGVYYSDIVENRAISDVYKYELFKKRYHLGMLAYVFAKNVKGHVVGWSKCRITETIRFFKKYI